MQSVSAGPETGPEVVAARRVRNHLTRLQRELSDIHSPARRLTEGLRVRCRDAAAKDAKIVVLRQQLALFRRQVAPPRFPWPDRGFVALLAGHVPSERW
jgi:hypothetical protein